ncbi:uncharacterized protein LOC133362813 isoform X2 [Lethenteron reissneri]|uniref:uncharacterized protein LOC133362813 isoform X2 n=1 Tax=Lethenteron reissneri TaxID=7753 RepID=UPI002AB79971|nr:uncharacterized protein LOC133362813 isoform X2 [Lethenteron reissneri]
MASTSWLMSRLIPYQDGLSELINFATHQDGLCKPSEGSRQADHLHPRPMEAVTTITTITTTITTITTTITTTRVVPLLLLLLLQGDLQGPLALPLDRAPRLLQTTAAMKRIDVQAEPHPLNTFAVITSGNVRCKRSSNSAYAESQQASDSRRKASPPEMLSQAERVYEAGEGEAVFMECSVSAWPPAHILWFRNYRSLSVTGERYHVFENGTLRILDLRREDADTYTCFATNNLGSSQLCAHLHVPVASDGEDRGQDGSGYEEEEDEEEDDEQETTAPDASSSRDGGADEDDDEDDDDEDDDEEDDEEDEVSATSPGTREGRGFHRLTLTMQMAVVSPVKSAARKTVRLKTTCFRRPVWISVGCSGSQVQRPIHAQFGALVTAGITLWPFFR